MNRWQLLQLIPAAARTLDLLRLLSLLSEPLVPVRPEELRL